MEAPITPKKFISTILFTCLAILIITILSFIAGR